MQAKIEHSVDDDLITIFIKGARQAAEHLTGRAFITQTWERVLDCFPSRTRRGVAGAIELGKPNVIAIESIKYLPATPTAVTATTLSALNSDNSFNDSGAGLAGFVVGSSVSVNGFSTASNNIYGIVTAVTANKLTIGGADGAGIVDEAAGESVTITQWATLPRAAYRLDTLCLPGWAVPAIETDWPDTQADAINAVRVRFTAGYGAAAAVPANIKQWMLLQIAAAYRNREAFAAGITVADLPNRWVDGLLDSERTFL